MKVHLVILLAMAASLALVQARNDEDDEKHFRESESQELFEEDEEPAAVKPKRIEDIPGLSEDLLIKTIDEARKETLAEEEKTPRTQQDGDQSLQKMHYRRGFVPELEPVRINAMVKERTIKKLAQKLGLTNEDGASALEGLEYPKLSDICKRTPRAVPNNKFSDEYRTIDGKGNNRYRPSLGQANTPFTRLLRPDYGDGISSPRKAADGTDLPNARKISSIVFKEKNRPSFKLAHMAMIWGQFLDHDITLGAEPETDCSKTCGLSGECFGIPIPAGDKPFKDRSCIQVKRSVPFCFRRRHRREQINTLTSFIDGSGVYSTNPTKFESLRDPSDRALLVEMRNPTTGLKNLLTKEQEGFCRITKPNLHCFRAGDARVNENSGLASMHTIWNREHNRIVNHLRTFNPFWKKNRLFFEARKIVGAMIQHITYNEFLPAILSTRMRKKFRLVLKPRKGHFRYFRGYNKRVNPSIFNAFSGAAYRFGHSMVQNQLNRFRKFKGRKTTPIQMNRFFDTSSLYQSSKGGVDSILRGLAKDRAQKVDGFFSKAVQEELVRGPGDLADLPALNIQRGRDHGLPGYNRFRRLAGLKRARRFSDLRDVMRYYQINKLKSVYKHVDDIDLFVGGMYERPLRYGVLGPTFSVIIAKQFKHLRYGDRFWYENRSQFTPSQLQEIRKASLARVICDNSDGIKRIYKRVLQRRYSSRCRFIEKVNLYKWKSH